MPGKPGFSHLQQTDVNTYFRTKSSYWREIYTTSGVQAEIIQGRHATILDWIKNLAVAPGSQVLEVGCGAGLMSIALARRGFRVCAIDLVEDMIKQARMYALESGTSERASFDIGDVHSLDFDDSSFDLVIAVGVLPWLEEAELAIREMARVTKPGGYIILTTANRAGLASLLDPLICPLLQPIKLHLKSALVRLGLLSNLPPMVFHSNREIDRALGRLGFFKIKGTTHGFAFSFFRRPVLPEPLGIAVNRRLQRLADRNVPCLRSTGMTYIVLARKERDNHQPL